MEIQKTSNKNSVFISITGDMDFSDSHLLKHALEHLDKKTVIIDFTKVGYMGSVCLAKLIGAAKKDHRFIMLNCNDRVYATFAMTGADRLFDFQ